MIKEIRRLLEMSYKHARVSHDLDTEWRDLSDKLRPIVGSLTYDKDTCKFTWHDNKPIPQKPISDLERFAFNQARFVFYTQHTMEREMIKRGISFERAFKEIQATPNGQKYLKNVSIREMYDEEKNPGTFMDKNTQFGAWLNDEYGNYVESFKDI